MNELMTLVEELRSMWETQMPAVTDQVIQDVGAEELIEAIRRGAVDVAPLAPLSTTDHVADALAAAVGTSNRRSIDPKFDGPTRLSGEDGF